MERLGARALLDETLEGLPRRRPRPPGPRRGRDRRVGCGATTGSPAPARPPRERGDRRQGGGDLGGLAQAVGPARRALIASATPTTTKTAPITAQCGSPTMKLSPGAGRGPGRSRPSRSHEPAPRSPVRASTPPGWHPSHMARRDRWPKVPAAPAGSGSPRPRPTGSPPGAPPDRGREAPRRRPSPDFLDTDPWRALRILSEFVEGFDALAGGRAGGHGLRVGPDDADDPPTSWRARSGACSPRPATRSSPAAGRA